MAARRIYNAPTAVAAVRLSEPARRVIDLLALRSGLTPSRVMRALIETQLHSLGFPLEPGEEAVKVPDWASVEAWAAGEAGTAR
jgi:hypothetical protein